MPDVTHSINTHSIRDTSRQNPLVTPAMVSLNAVDNDPVVKLVHSLLIDAVRLGASDLHFEPYEHAYRVRFRIDGVLKQMSILTLDLIPQVSARLKIMAQMDISERRLPQDGRITIKTADNNTLNYRASALPTLFGEKIVLRVIDAAESLPGIDDLGLEPDQKHTFLEALHQPQGIVLITGPTGSGKTLSLYTGLDLLNTDSTNISTVEDPVEITLTGINQVSVNPKIGLNFDTALKSFLRQDPDVVMVGEIRDLETADTAIRAAQTGHLVLSTLHTNSAAETLTRLHHMGIASFNIATAISLVVAQRLARRLCEHCKKRADFPKLSLLQMGFLETDFSQYGLNQAGLNHSNFSQSQPKHLPTQPSDSSSTAFNSYEAVGCEHCIEGYKGRVGIFEVMSITDELAQLIMQSGNALQIKALAEQQGFYSLRRAAILKVLQGTISIQEMNRITVT